MSHILRDILIYSNVIFILNSVKVSRDLDLLEKNIIHK